VTSLFIRHALTQRLVVGAALDKLGRKVHDILIGGISHITSLKGSTRGNSRTHGSSTTGSRSSLSATTTSSILPSSTSQSANTKGANKLRHLFDKEATSKAWVGYDPTESSASLSGHAALTGFLNVTLKLLTRRQQFGRHEAFAVPLSATTKAHDAGVVVASSQTIQTTSSSADTAETRDTRPGDVTS
jgi:phosphatidate phosphatase APP1